MSATIVATGLKEMGRFFQEFPEIAEEAAVLAINETATRDGLALIKTDMRDDINFPAGYLEGDRLRVARKARRGDLTAVIRGRDRATSLARFASGQTPATTRGRGVRVNVKGGRGGAQVMEKAFLMKLRNGNIGLAIRLPQGASPRATRGAKPLVIGGEDTGLFLLYGPSVEQVMRGVVDDRIDDIGELVTRKFLRQFGRLSRGR